MIKKLTKKTLARFGWQLSRLPSGQPDAKEQWTSVETPYTERAEHGPSNIQTKLENVAKGLPFEFPDILNLNEAVVKLCDGARRICELGCGTGNFAVGAADADPNRQIVASEFDAPTYEWVKANKGRPNVRYVLGPVPKQEGAFDLVVAIEVIEHVADYPGFIRSCQKLAPRCPVTTPNRARGAEYHHSGPPPYYKHVREWTAGEFYWVMRSFYNEVILYALTSQTKPEFIKVSVDTKLSPLIADCRRPRSS